MDKKLLGANVLFVTLISGVLLILDHAKCNWRFYLVFYMCFLIAYYIFHILAKRYAARISRLSKPFFCFELSTFIFVGCYLCYGINIFILEGIARLTNNFWDGIHCGGPGCIFLFGALAYIPYLVFVILDIILFTPILYGIKRAVPVKDVRPSSLYFSFFRAFCYLCLGICSLIAVYLWLSQIRM